MHGFLELKLHHRSMRQKPLCDEAGCNANDLMEWTSPEFEEVSLNCENTSYANAAL